MKAIEFAQMEVQCFGRDSNRKEVLGEPVVAKVDIRRNEDLKSIFISVECPHNTGGHGQRCKASHPGQDKVGPGVLCPFSLALPRTTDCAIFE